VPAIADAIPTKRSETQSFGIMFISEGDLAIDISNVGREIDVSERVHFRKEKLRTCAGIAMILAVEAR
jgi:hypothetical protein